MAKKPGVQIDLVLEVIIAKYEVRPGKTEHQFLTWKTTENPMEMFDELARMGVPTKRFREYVHATRLG